VVSGRHPADGSNRGDNDDNDGDIGFTLPDDDPAENEEEETSTTDVLDTMSPLPAAATNRPRRTVVKPARFRITEHTDDMPAQAH